MDTLYYADGDAETDVSPFMKCLRTLDAQHARFVMKDSPHRIHRYIPPLRDLPTRKVLFQRGTGVSTARPLDLLWPATPDGKVAARPRLNYC